MTVLHDIRAIALNVHPYLCIKWKMLTKEWRQRERRKGDSDGEACRSRASHEKRNNIIEKHTMDKDLLQSSFLLKVFFYIIFCFFLFIVSRFVRYNRASVFFISSVQVLFIYLITSFVQVVISYNIFFCSMANSLQNVLLMHRLTLHRTNPHTSAK